MSGLRRRYGREASPDRTFAAPQPYVVTVGWNDQDFVLALGVVPTLTRAWFDNYNDFPWVREATDGAGVETMGGDGINFDAIGAEHPDVIIAIYESIDERTYNWLSDIAPTVVQSDEYADEETLWDVQMLTTGRALGMEERARELVDEVETAIDEAVAAHPEFADTVLVEDYGPTSGGHYLIGADDPRRALFDALGFAAQDTVGDLSEESSNSWTRTSCSSTARSRRTWRSIRRSPVSTSSRSIARSTPRSTPT